MRLDLVCVFQFETLGSQQSNSAEATRGSVSTLDQKLWNNRSGEARGLRKDIQVFIVLKETTFLYLARRLLFLEAITLIEFFMYNY